MYTMCTVFMISFCFYIVFSSFVAIEVLKRLRSFVWHFIVKAINVIAAITVRIVLFVLDVVEIFYHFSMSRIYRAF